MKIALYYPWVYLTSGAERTILEVTGRSRHSWTIFTNRFEAQNTFPEFAQRDMRVLSSVSVKRSVGAAARAGLKILTQRLPMEQFDALLVVCEGLGDCVVFRNANRPVLCICLTPLRIAFDQHYRERYMDGKGLGRRLAVSIAARLFRWVDRRVWRRYARVICISEEVKGRVLRGGLAPESRLEVAYVGLGVDPPEPSDKLGDYFLLPGRIMWTKNIELGISAFQRFRSMKPEFERFRLIITGIVDHKSKAYLARLQELAGRDSNIEFCIHPSDAELTEIYSNAYGVLFTAFNEDWGIVPLEGMAFGKPVVVCNRGGPRESVEHGVQGFCEDPEPEAFARRMAELAADEDLARRMGTAGRSHSRRFSWDHFTERVDECIEASC
ncbi:MAG: glycosyltransferase [Phycisphaerales bacterium]|nr:MAG: glycosyltransferase [Phycisphaerales bacterium]